MRLIKYRDLHIELPTLRPRVAGRFLMIATKPDGRSRIVAEFPNLITDVGLARMGVGQFRNVCAVGTGSAVPTTADTSLQSTRARTSNTAPNVPGGAIQSSPPYYSTTSAGFRFSAGTASGNLTEVGVGWLPGSGMPPAPNDYQLWSRALILDGFGVPTSVTILGDEVLDVFYSIRLYPPTVDAEYDISISGETYNCISRAANVTTFGDWPAPSQRVLFVATPGGYASVVSAGPIGAITASPTGLSTVSGNPSFSNADYSIGSLVQDATYSWGLDAGNVTGGIRSVYYRTNVGAYQTQFTLPTPREDGTVTIPKTRDSTLSIGFRVGWARHT